MTQTATENPFDRLKHERYELKDWCRVCMCQKQNMKCVFSMKTHKTIEEIEFCTGILMIKEDGLPTKLCESCLATLAVAFKFKTDCLQSDEAFRKILQQRSLIADNIKKEIDEVADNDNFQYQELVVNIKYENNETSDTGDKEYKFKPALEAETLKPGQQNKKKTTLDPGGKPKKTMRKTANNLNHTDDVKKIAKAKGCSNPKTKEQKKTAKVIDPEQMKEKRRLAKLNCVECNITFTSRELINMHKREVHKREVICEICGKQFIHRSSYYTHLQSHFPPSHQCSICDYKTSHKMDLVKHLRIHSDVKQYVCEYCTRSFHNTSNLRDHIRRHHLDSAKNHACPRCERKFYSAHKLRRHLDSHDNVKRHECETCHAQFTRRCHWKKHLEKAHSIIVPRMRPGRQKTNLVVTGTKSVFQLKKKPIENEIV